MQIIHKAPARKHELVLPVRMRDLSALKDLDHQVSGSRLSVRRVQLQSMVTCNEWQS